MGHFYLFENDQYPDTPHLQGQRLPRSAARRATVLIPRTDARLRVEVLVGQIRVSPLGIRVTRGSQSVTRKSVIDLRVTVFTRK